MTTPVSDIIRHAAKTLQDEGAIRYTTPALVGYFNDFELLVLSTRPDLMSKMVPLTLVAGARQTIPADGARLLDVTSNVSGRAIRICDRSSLDSFTPNWRSDTPAIEQVNFMFDPREPKVFEVYPPALVMDGPSSAVNLVYAFVPTKIAIPSDGSQYTDVVGNMSAPDSLKPAAQDYVLARAYELETEVEGAANKSADHMAKALSYLQGELGAAAAAAPPAWQGPGRNRQLSL